ncbi:PAS domain S-box protein [Desulforamulus ruminis]|uniref:histidine kinase n=1 Tax=Desulforamulus ruminis (strain ATCC 23193 / DSM 2154 / NCIMB 8452 / DL) TaxID=696281 RepID=F6DV23_DESRL|nr:PAS domain S-box protein [Desulforamulus ruminis]AEG59089.1 PAS sensor protein [Desulforamulus ruminis DSM 2154]
MITCLHQLYNFGRFINTLPTAIVFVNDKGDIVKCNERFTSYFPDLKGEDLIGKPASGSEELLGAQIARVLKGEEVYAQFILWQGREFLTNAFPLKDWETGAIPGAIIIFQDITSEMSYQRETYRLANLQNIAKERTYALNQEISLRQQIEKKLLNLNKKVSGMLEGIKNGYMTLDQTFRFIYVNKEAERFIELPKEELIGHSMWDKLPTELGLKYYNEYHRALQEQTVVHFEAFLLNGPKWAEVYLYPSQEGLSICLNDITKQKYTEEKLRESKEGFQALFNHSLDGIILNDADGRIIAANPSACKMFGRTEKEMRQMNRAEIIDLTDPRVLALAKQREHQDQFSKEINLMRKNGAIFSGKVTSTIFRGENNQLLSCLIIRDITKNKKFEQEMSRLDRLNLIGEMAAGIGHEVRNPMTTVRGFLQMLKGKERYAGDQEYFDLMISELDRANSIITEFLSVSKSTSNHFEIKSLNDIIEEIYPLIQANALNHNKNIKFNPGNIVSFTLIEKEIRQMILNFVNNGLESMESGGLITLSTYMDQGEIVLEIKDQGTGIEPGVLDKIGTPFVTTKVNGTGLGLAVCYNIAARHKATIEIQTGSKGTTFFVRFKIN